MGRHVPPHRWAAVATGALDDPSLAAMERHAAGCRRCAVARQRVIRSREAFADIREIGEAEPPRLNWEHIGARIYWVTSSEQRKRQTERIPVVRSRRPWLYAGIAAVAVVLALGGLRLWSAGPDTEPAEQPPEQQVASIPAPPTPGVLAVELVPEPAEALSGVVTFLQGEVRAGAGSLELDRTLSAGDRLTTGDDSRVTVQFASGSGFTLEPGSSLELRAFDSRRVALVLDGAIDIDVEHRPADQRFEVIAGDRTVSVRGTSFRVDNRDGGLAVACARGEVAVVGDDGEQLIGAGELLSIDVGSRLAEQAVVPLPASAEEALSRAVAARLLPAWTGPERLRATSSVLALAAPAEHDVTVDGEVVARGSFKVRVMSGRHHVRTAGGTGRWLRVAPGEQAEARTESPERDAAGRSRLRRRQLDRALNSGARVRPCLRGLEKQGLLEGSFIELDIGVNGDGSLGHLNVVGTNLPRQAANCARSVVDAARLPAGPAASLRYRVSF